MKAPSSWIILRQVLKCVIVWWQKEGITCLTEYGPSIIMGDENIVDL